MVFRMSTYMSVLSAFSWRASTTNETVSAPSAAMSSMVFLYSSTQSTRWRLHGHPAEWPLVGDVNQPGHRPAPRICPRRAAELPDVGSGEDMTQPMTARV